MCELAPKVLRYLFSFPLVSTAGSPVEEEEVQRIAFTWIILFVQIEDFCKLKNQWILI